MNNDKLIIYEPDYRHKIGFFKVWIIMIRNIIKSRELIYQLFKRDFLMAYKKSFLGMGWILIQPVIGIISWVFMNATGILQPGTVGIPYPAYVLFSSSIWSLFVGFYGSAAETLGAGSTFIMQVKYPHEAMLIKQAAQFLANFLLVLLLNIIILLFFNVIPDWKIVFLPFFILPLFFIGSSLGLVVSVISVVVPDLQRAFNVLMQLLMYITPVIYSSRVDNPLLQKIMIWNPLTYLVGGVRDIIIYGKMENIQYYIYSSILALLMFMFSWKLFYVSEEKVIEKMI